MTQRIDPEGQAHRVQLGDLHGLSRSTSQRGHFFFGQERAGHLFFRRLHSQLRPPARNHKRVIFLPSLDRCGSPGRLGRRILRPQPCLALVQVVAVGSNANWREWQPLVFQSPDG